jgi:hypothetical protein
MFNTMKSIKNEMKIAGTFFGVILLILVLGCSSNTEKSNYEEIVEKELAKGVRNDSLFLGYKLGMSKRKFYSYSWDLNKQKIVMQGPQNQTVEYQLDDNELPHAATMNFYPDFRDDKIYRMRTTFSYKGWAPWNDDLGEDSLIYDVKVLMEKWYDKGFIKFNESEIGLTFKKVDGNREIVITKAGDGKSVNVLFRDLTAKKEES